MGKNVSTSMFPFPQIEGTKCISIGIKEVNDKSAKYLSFHAQPIHGTGDTVEI